MGIQDRDYYHESPKGFSLRQGNAVPILIAATAAVWLVQVALVHSFHIEKYLACTPRDVFESFFLWQPITANFLHLSGEIWHLVMNMFFLFFFGRELEVIYGRRNMLIFYLTAGSVAILAEAAVCHFSGNPDVEILGASGAVMGCVVLYTFLFPTRELLVLGLVPVPVWLLCVLFVLGDLSGALGGRRGEGVTVAHWAHLAGGAFAVLYKFVDLRWETITAGLGIFRRLSGPAASGQRGPRLVRAPKSALPRTERQSTATAEPARDPVSARIDDLLEKISRGGRESLSAEEMEFLNKNSKRYRSEG